MTSKDEAIRYLGNVVPEQCFWVNNGPILKNLDDLANILPEISDEAYEHHANKEKNDFSIWIDEVIGDKKLANDLLNSKNKASALKKIRARLNSLKKRVG